MAVIKKPNKLLIFGATKGGQELLKVIIDDINKVSYTWEVIGFIDYDISKKGTTVSGYPVLGHQYDQDPRGIYGICGVMDNDIRQKVTDENIIGKGFNLASLVHPSVIATGDFIYGPGAVVFPGCKISYNVRLGRGVFVSYNCLLGHSLAIDDFTFIGPSVTIPGDCRIGKSCTIGAGCNFLQQISVGDRTTIGIGTTLTKSVGDHKLVMDFPRTVETDKN